MLLLLWRALLLLQGYHVNSDEFNYNYGQAKAAVGQYNEAIEVLSSCRT